MDEHSLGPIIHYQRTPTWDYLGVGFAILYNGFFFAFLISMLLGYREAERDLVLFSAMCILISVYSMPYSVSSIATSHDGLHITFMLSRTQFIPWHEIQEIRVQYSRNLTCVVKYGKNSIERLPLYINYRPWAFWQSKPKILIAAIVKHAELGPAGKDIWGARIYKYGWPLQLPTRGSNI